MIAYAAGGALETVIEGKTGLFFHQQTPDALAQAVLEFVRREGEFDPQVIKANALRFDVERFREEMHAVIEKAVSAAGVERDVRSDVKGELQ